jgi:CheY-like chemotaxis protein
VATIHPYAIIADPVVDERARSYTRPVDPAILCPHRRSSASAVKRYLYVSLYEERCSMLIQTATVLVIEDDEAVRSLLVTILADRPARSVTGAGSGVEALAYLDRAWPDLILLDIKMSDIDGFALYRCIRDRAESANVPVLFTTALSADETAEQMRQLSGPSVTGATRGRTN